MAVIDFACPECKRPCRVSDIQRAVQHSDPVCGTWRAHRGNMQEFLRLALMGAKGNLVLGELGKAEVQAQPTDENTKNRLLDELYEGMKKL